MAKPAEIHEVDNALRGVCVPQGKHQIVMDYRPRPSIWARFSRSGMAGRYRSGDFLAESEQVRITSLTFILIESRNNTREKCFLSHSTSTSPVSAESA